MPTTGAPGNIWYPDATSPVAPLENLFLQQATSVNDALNGIAPTATGWTFPTLTNATAYAGNPLGYKTVTVAGVTVVYFRGRIKNMVTGGLLASLPVGLRPPGGANVFVSDLSDVRINFLSNGEIRNISGTVASFLPFSFIVE